MLLVFLLSPILNIAWGNGELTINLPKIVLSFPTIYDHIVAFAIQHVLQFSIISTVPTSTQKVGFYVHRKSTLLYSSAGKNTNHNKENFVYFYKQKYCL